MKIFLASVFAERGAMRVWRELIENQGHKVTSHWIDSPFKSDDDATPIELSIAAEQNVHDIEDCDYFVLDSRLFVQNIYGHGGRHIDFGIALALKKKICLIGTPESPYHLLPPITHHETIISFLKELREENNPAPTIRPANE